MIDSNVIYKEFAPDYRLNDYIYRYWYFKVNTDITMPFDIMPDGYFDLLIILKNGIVSDIILTGIWNKMITVYYDQDTEVFGIRFKPIALDSLLNFRINDLINSSASLELKDFSIDKELVNLYLSISHPKMIEYLNNIYLKLFTGIQTNNKIKTIFEIINYTQGITPITDLAGQIGISSRHIHRVCKEYLGLSAKEYSSIVRFRENLKLLMRDKKDFTGYFDQSHFIKDFKQFTGTTPQNINLCDVRFLQYFNGKKH